MFEVIEVQNGMFILKCSLESLTLLKEAVVKESMLDGSKGVMYMLLESALRNAEIVGTIAAETGYHFEGRVKGG